jgi:hypothetical protein
MDAWVVPVICVTVVIGLNIWERRKAPRKLYKDKYSGDMHRYCVAMIIECDLPGDEPGVGTNRVLPLIKEVLEEYEFKRFKFIRGGIKLEGVELGE